MKRVDEALGGHAVFSRVHTVDPGDRAGRERELRGHREGNEGRGARAETALGPPHFLQE